MPTVALMIGLRYLAAISKAVSVKWAARFGWDETKAAKLLILILATVFGASLLSIGKALASDRSGQLGPVERVCWSAANSAVEGPTFEGPTFEGPAFDPRLLNFEQVAEVEPITAGFAILEGPIWYRGQLYLSHIGYSNGVDPSPADLVYLDESNTIQTLRANAGTNGMALTRRGTVVAALHGGRGLGRLAFINLPTADWGPYEWVFASEFEGAAFNSPNDLTVSRQNRFYFTDPSYQAPIPNPQLGERAYYLVGFGKVTAFGAGIERPNGIVLSRDEKRLYVGGVNGLFLFDLAYDGKVIDEPLQIRAGEIAGVDGMTRDCAGNLYVTASGRVIVLDENHEVLASRELEGVTNLAFGGDDGKTLFATTLGASPKLFSSPSAIAGLPY